MIWMALLALGFIAVWGGSETWDLTGVSHRLLGAVRGLHRHPAARVDGER